MSERDADVMLKDNVLTLTGMVDAGMCNQLAPLCTEYNVGNYYRQFTLNEEIDDSRIKARMRNSVLEVELPKREQAKPRKIQVQSV